MAADDLPEDAVIVGGLNAMGAGLYSLGIPKDNIVRYETVSNNQHEPSTKRRSIL